ncbi:MAG: regulatory signaling modulator protein AmpE [Xanthomonadales bacterium]|nr:regulatory signaling modulator protein AmpE [Xanthomonadales bacterium]
MSLLIVALVLVLIHLFSPVWPKLRLQIFGAVADAGFSLMERFGSRTRTSLLVLIGAAVGVVAWLQFVLVQLDAAWPWFLFSLAMLLLAWGSRDLDEDVRYFLEHCEDAEAACKAAAPLIASYRKPAPVSRREQTIKGVFYQGLVRWFGVLFWFLVAGAAGALLFRLPHVLLCESDNRSRLTSAQARLLKGMAAILDLIPAALATLSLAVVGNFDAVVGAWRKHFEEEHRSALAWDYEFLPEVGYRTVVDDNDSDAAFGHDYTDARGDVARAMNLVWRALMAWLTVVALLVLAGLVN